MSGRRILVVDDDPIGRLITTSQLEELGHEVVAVDGGEAAVAAAAGGGFDAILMDRQMPGVDGCEASRRIRALPDPVAASVPIAALSAGDDGSAREQCAQIGMDDYVVKPVETAVLAACVDRLVARRDATSTGGGELEPGAQVASDVRRTLADLEVAVGGRATVELAVSRFLEEVEVWVPAIASDDPHVRSRTAHTLKGASRALGALEVGRWAERLEQDPEQDVVDDLRAAVDRARAVLRRYLDEASPTTR